MEKFPSGVSVNSYAFTNQLFGVYFMGRKNFATDHFSLPILAAGRLKAKFVAHLLGL